MTTSAASVDVDVPVEVAWRAITNWRGQGSWMPLTSVDVTEGPGDGIGSKLRARTGLGPVGFDDDMVIDVWQPPHRCEVQHLGRFITGRGIFTVDALTEGSSRITWAEVPEPGSLAHKLGAVGDAVTHAALSVALRRLAHSIQRLSAIR